MQIFEKNDSQKQFTHNAERINKATISFRNESIWVIIFMVKSLMGCIGLLPLRLKSFAREHVKNTQNGGQL